MPDYTVDDAPGAAREDDRVREQLAILHGGVHATVRQVPGSDVRMVTFTDAHGHQVIADVDRHGLVSGTRGDTLPYTSSVPSPGAPGNPCVWVGALFLFALVALVRGPGARLWNVAVALLLAASAAWGVAQVGWAPVGHFRAAAIAIYGTGIAVTAGLAWWCLLLLPHDGQRKRRSARPLLLVWALVAVAMLALGARDITTARWHHPSDVAVSGAVGAELLHGGTLPYGHMLPTQTLRHGDTYGLLDYVAYLPVQPLADSFRTRAQLAAVLFDLLAALAIASAARACGATRAGVAWSVAMWATCPIAAMSVVFGYNDVLVAAAACAAVALATRPWARGALAGVAGGVKLLPLAMAGALLRRRGEPARTTWAVVAGAGLVTLGWLAVAAGGRGNLHRFTHAVAFQLHRSDTASLWGLLDAGWLRLPAALVALAVAGIVVVHCLRFPLTIAGMAAGSGAILLAVTLPARHWWFAYLVWGTSLVLAAAPVIGTGMYHEPDGRPGGDPNAPSAS